MIVLQRGGLQFGYGHEIFEMIGKVADPVFKFNTNTIQLGDKLEME